MNVAKSRCGRASTIAHLLCVPGSTSDVPRPGIAGERADELRFLAAHDVGHARGIAACDDAGHDRELAVPGDASQRCGQRVEVGRDMRRTAPRSSPGGCRSCRRRAAARVVVASRRGASSSACANSPSRTRWMPSGALRASRIRALRDRADTRAPTSCPSRSRSRRVLHGGTFTAWRTVTAAISGRVAASRRPARSRATGVRPPVRSSRVTSAPRRRRRSRAPRPSAAPSGVASFFQNGARVFR